MRILVFGAAGRTGRLVVEQALGHGHDVTAFVHETPLELTHDHLGVLRGDAMDFESVLAAVGGQTAVVSALGPGRSAAGITLSEGIGNIIHAMAVEGVHRLVVESASGTFARKDRRLSLGFRTMIATVLRATYDDLEAMEQRVMASDLDWTIVRPVGLTDGPLTGTYRLSLDGDLLSDASAISRADVAALMLKALSGETYVRRAVTIGY